MRKLRALLTAYREAGGAQPIVLLHDEAHGVPLIDALARFGDGLPANVLPLAVNEVTQVGLEAVAAAFAYGAAAVRLLLRAKPRHDVAGLRKTLALAEPILAGLGFGAGRVATIETDDPDALGDALRAIDAGEPAPRPASFLPVGGKRDVLRLALRELQRAAPAPVDVVALPAGAPFGAVEINVEGCTLCLACVSACPTGALARRSRAADAALRRGCLRAMRAVQGDLSGEGDHAARRSSTSAPPPRLRACSKEEEPFHCIRCGKPFGVKSTIERVAAKLEGKHWMFQNSGAAPRRDQDVRGLPGGGDHRAAVRPLRRPPRPKARTTEDYLREREEQERASKTET